MRPSSFACLPLLSLALAVSAQSNSKALVGLTPENKIRACALSFTEPVSQPRLLPAQSQTRPPFVSKDGRFSIRLPAAFPAFTERSSAQQTAVGNIDLHVFNSETQQGAYVLGYSDFPADSFTGRNVEEILQNARDGGLNSVNGTLEKQKSITVQTYPGLSMYGSANYGGRQVYFRFDFILVKTRLYQVGFLTYRKEDMDTPEVLNVFKSFHIE